MDRIGLLTYAVIASALLAGACLLLALSGSTPLLVLALLGLRLAGQGMMSHASITGMARSFTPNRGKAIALATLGHPAGEGCCRSSRSWPRPGSAGGTSGSVRRQS